MSHWLPREILMRVSESTNEFWMIEAVGRYCIASKEIVKSHSETLIALYMEHKIQTMEPQRFPPSNYTPPPLPWLRPYTLNLKWERYWRDRMGRFGIYGYTIILYDETWFYQRMEIHLKKLEASNDKGAKWHLNRLHFLMTDIFKLERRDGFPLVRKHMQPLTYDSVENGKGYNRNGLDEDALDKDGRNSTGYDKEGYDVDGYDELGLDRTGL